MRPATDSTKLPVLASDNSVIGSMTLKQAFRHGNKHMPADLKRAGFKSAIFTSDPEIHGEHYYRIGYGK